MDLWKPVLTARIIDQFCDMLRIDHQYTRPESNGIIERMNGEVGRHLKVLVNTARSYDLWSDLLPFVQRIINMSYHSSIGTTPGRMVYGDTWHTRQHTVNLPAEVPRQTNEDYIQTMTSVIEQLYVVSEQHQETVVGRRLQQSVEDPMEYQVGDHVLVCYPDRAPTKHTPKWRGPYIVVTKLNENRYTVQHCNTMTMLEVHITMCKLFSMREVEGTTPETALREVAVLDNSESVIEKIIRHHYYNKGYGKTGPDKKKYDFEVKFYNDDELYWMKYTEVKNSEALDVYLNEHPGLQL
mgnify:CR=1 FL=1